jgi:hypothetical protein
MIVGLDSITVVVRSPARERQKEFQKKSNTACLRRGFDAARKELTRDEEWGISVDVQNAKRKMEACKGDPEKVIQELTKEARVQ